MLLNPNTRFRLKLNSYKEYNYIFITLIDLTGITTEGIASPQGPLRRSLGISLPHAMIRHRAERTWAPGQPAQVICDSGLIKVPPLRGAGGVGR